MRHRALLLCAALALPACTDENPAFDPDTRMTDAAGVGGGDQGAGGAADLAVPVEPADLAGTRPPDLAGTKPPDLAGAPPPDLAGTPPPDLAAQADLLKQPDLAPPPDLYSPPDLVANCGNVGQSCCGGGLGQTGTCTAPFTRCQNNFLSSVCQSCGGANEPCCDGNTCKSGCCANGTCIAVGAACPSNAGACQQGGSCGNCGGLNQSCCGQFINNFCSQPGTTCSGQFQGNCVACGQKGQRCCDNNTCTTGLKCNFGLGGQSCQ